MAERDGKRQGTETACAQTFRSLPRKPIDRARGPGEDNWSGYGFDLHPHVTFPSMAVLAVFILLALMFKEHAARIFEVALEFITRMSGWFLILAVNIFVVAAVRLIGGGLETLQVASVCAGLPFALILLVMIYSLYLGFRQEDYVEEAVRARLEDVEAEHELAETIAAIVEEKTGGA